MTRSGGRRPSCRGCRLAQRDDAAVADADVGLDHPPVVEDHRAVDDEVGGTLGAGGGGLAHGLADHLSRRRTPPPPGGTGSHRAVLGDLDEQVGVGQPDAVTGGGAYTGRSARGTAGPSAQASFAVRPGTTRHRQGAPAGTVCSMPGSNRTAVPAAMSRRWPWAAARSNSSARFRLGEVEVRPDLHGPVAGVDDPTSTRGTPGRVSIHPSAAMTSPGTTDAGRSLRALRSRIGWGRSPAWSRRGRSPHLHLLEELGDAVHDVVTGEDGAAALHELGDEDAVARALEDVVGDQRRRLGQVELQPPCLARRASSAA